MNFVMVMEYSTGQMVPIMKDNGFSIRLKDKEHFGMLKEIFIEENSKMIWQMDMENIFILTEVNIKEILKMMFKKDMEKKNG